MLIICMRYKKEKRERERGHKEDCDRDVRKMSGEDKGMSDGWARGGEEGDRWEEDERVGEGNRQDSNRQGPEE